MSNPELLKNRDNVTGMPKGIPYIIGNELAERFSFYGMKTILTVFMTGYILNSEGVKDVMPEEEAKVWYHLFVMLTYLIPIAGAFLSDILWGKYRTIIVLSIVYCAGHIALALDETRLGLSLGLGMIALGSGGIKPCVSAHVGDQFGKKNGHLIERVFSYFYLSINIGSAISSILTPILLVEYGPSVAFGVPGAIMILATFIFWFGRKQFISVPPVGWKVYSDFLFSKEGGKTILNLLGIYLFVSVFWSLFDQTGSSWVLQAKSEYVIKEIDWLGITLLPSQIQAANPIIVIILVPIFTFWIYPKLNKNGKFGSMKRITIGFFIAAFSFVIIAWMEHKIQNGVEVSILWQFVAYVFLTIAEVMVSVTTLEFAYTQAPKSLKSLIMSFYLLAVFLGNTVTLLVNLIIMNEDKTSKLEGASYYWFFVGLTVIAGIAFGIIYRNYKEKSLVGGQDA